MLKHIAVNMQEENQLDETLNSQKKTSTFAA